MPKLLAISPYPYRSADTRYRISQFGPGLEKAGWKLTLRPFMDDAFFSMYNLPGHHFEKILRMGCRSVLRLLDVLSADQYDVVLIHKEAFPFGPPIMEYIIKRRQPCIIYDMDDAFWTHPPQIKQIGRILRDSRRISKVIKLSSHVLAGNGFLVNFARKQNSNVTIFPTVIDTSRYYLRKEIDDDVVTIGWVGRWSSSFYLESLVNVFERIYRNFAKVIFKFVGAAPFDYPSHLPIEFIPWRLETEIEDLIPFDIGIMPLADDIYAKGKCGFKLLQYMALGIPSIASPVGVNQEIITDGENGFLATSENEWFEKLSLLISNKKRRKMVGIAARETVEERYSLNNALPLLITIFHELTT